MLFGVEILCYLLQKYICYLVQKYIYTLKQNIETLGAELELRENKQVKVQIKRRARVRKYITCKTVLEKEEKPRKSGETKRREESEKEKSVEPCCQLI